MRKSTLWIVLLFSLVLSLALSACSESKPGARLRIVNRGTHDIKNLTVLFPDERIPFGDVPAGTTTEYQPARKGVYNYGAYEYTLDGQTVTQPVIDWVGESPKQGDFTYTLQYDPTRQNMQQIELVDVSGN